MPPVNPRYPYTETDIKELTTSLLKQRGLQLSPHGTVLAADKVYTINKASITIAVPQIIVKGTGGQADPYKAAELNEAVKETLVLAKDIPNHILLFPLHINNNHWVMVCAYFSSSSVSEVMLCNSIRAAAPIEYIKNLINPIFRAHLKSASLFFKYLSSATNYGFFTPPVDRQPDSVSCGAFVVKFIEDMVTRGKLHAGRMFTAEEVLALRQKHVDVDPVFAERQFNARVEDDIPAAFGAKLDASIFADEKYETFATYLSELTSERELFLTVAQQFIKAESDLEVLHTPKGSVDEDTFLLLQDLDAIAATEIKEWFNKHESAIDPELFACFFDKSKDGLNWQTKEDQVDGKGALLVFLPKACALISNPRPRPNPQTGF